MWKAKRGETKKFIYIYLYQTTHKHVKISVSEQRKKYYLFTVNVVQSVEVTSRKK